MSDFDHEAPESIAEGNHAVQMPPHVFETLRSFLLATAGFWLIVAWVVWQIW